MNRTIEAMKQVQTTWTNDEYERLFSNAEQRVARRRLRRVQRNAAAAGVFAVGAVALVFAALWTPQAARTQSVVTATPSAEELLRFRDGSTVQLLRAGTTITPRLVSATQTHLELVQGSARFSVSAQAIRHFRVDVGTVSVEVLGTKFDLERAEAQTTVRVQEGLVWVTWPGGGTQVHAGQSGVFPPVSGVARDDSHALPSQAANFARPDWRRLARRQDFSAALEVIERDSPAIRDEPGDLLLAADSARLGGKPAKALPYLQSVVKRHAADARAPAAAFTLGRLWLDTLGDPSKAALSFKTAQRLSPQGPLAEDALFRQTEAWVRAGEPHRAQDAFMEYQKTYPAGRKLAALRLMLSGGL